MPIQVLTTVSNDITAQALNYGRWENGATSETHVDNVIWRNPGEPQTVVGLGDLIRVSAYLSSPAVGAFPGQGGDSAILTISATDPRGISTTISTDRITAGTNSSKEGLLSVDSGQNVTFSILPASGEEMLKQYVFHIVIEKF